MPDHLNVEVHDVKNRGAL